MGIKNAQFRSGEEFYYSYDWEDVAFRWDPIEETIFRKFRGKTEHVCPSDSKLREDGRLEGVLISKDDYLNW